MRNDENRKLVSHSRHDYGERGVDVVMSTPRVERFQRAREMDEAVIGLVHENESI